MPFFMRGSTTAYLLIDVDVDHHAALLSTAGLFLGMLVLLEIGRRIGVRRLAKDPEGATVGGGTVEGAVFGLLALLVDFTFSGAGMTFLGDDLSNNQPFCALVVQHEPA
jgi:hypothetical protein